MTVQEFSLEIKGICKFAEDNGITSVFTAIEVARDLLQDYYDEMWETMEERNGIQGISRPSVDDDDVRNFFINLVHKPNLDDILKDREELPF